MRTDSEPATPVASPETREPARRNRDRAALFLLQALWQGFYPFDQEQEIAPNKKQYDLQRAAAELFTEVPYERASQIFESLNA